MSSIVVVLTRVIPPKSKTKSCSVCGSTTTKMGRSTLKNGIIRKYPNWCKGMCMNCYNNKVSNPKHRPINNPKRIRFKDKRILLKQSPRVGVCNLCRRVVPFDIKKTDMNHFTYDEQNPSSHTLELCVACHRHYPKRE